MRSRASSAACSTSARTCSSAVLSVRLHAFPSGSYRSLREECLRNVTLIQVLYRGVNPSANYFPKTTQPMHCELNFTSSKCSRKHPFLETWFVYLFIYLIMGSLTGCFLDFLADSVWKWAISGTGSSPATSSSPKMAACWEKSMSCMKDMLRFRAKSRSCKQSRKRVVQPRVYSSIMRPERAMTMGVWKRKSRRHAIRRECSGSELENRKACEPIMHVQSKRSDVTHVSWNTKR